MLCDLIDTCLGLRGHHTQREEVAFHDKESMLHCGKHTKANVRDWWPVVAMRWIDADFNPTDSGACESEV